VVCIAPVCPRTINAAKVPKVPIGDFDRAHRIGQTRPVTMGVQDEKIDL